LKDLALRWIRAHAFREAGADIAFVEAPLNEEQLKTIAGLPWPQLANIVIGGKTPERSNDQMKKPRLRRRALRQHRIAGCRSGMQRALRHLRTTARSAIPPTCWRPSLSASGSSTSLSFQAMEQKYK